MIDEKILLIEKLKDNAVEYLGQKMIEDIGETHYAHTKMLEEKLYQWVVWARQYYSTTEIKKAYAILVEKHRSVFSTISLHAYDDIRKLDEYLNLDEHKILHSYVRRPFKMKNFPPPTKPTAKNIHAIWKGNNLKNLVRQLRQEKDKRRMRRLKRKETARKKKGVRLFDSIIEE